MTWWLWYITGFATMLAIEIVLIVLVTRTMRRHPEKIVRRFMKSASGGKRANVPSRNPAGTDT